jgi:hypothetical protein
MTFDILNRFEKAKLHMPRNEPKHLGEILCQKLKNGYEKKVSHQKMPIDYVVIFIILYSFTEQTKLNEIMQLKLKESIDEKLIEVY